MIEPRFRWRRPDPITLDPAFRAAALAAGFSERVAGLLHARGVDDVAGLEAFIAPVGVGLHDPALLPDADRLLARVDRARSDGERILVFGDFDADGLTGLAMMVRALRLAGLDAEPYVPSRLEEGHGLSLRAVEAAVAAGQRLIVTVDTGSTSGAEVAEAGRRGIDVIVTDHHRVPPDAPRAVALVNPHRADSNYPDPRLAGSGVAFKVAQLLLGDLPDGPEAALRLAELATIGTVADVAPIIGENRAIARIGLDRIRRSPLPGLAALLELAGVAAEAVDLETVAFTIAPRLNAAGRVGDATDAARLLLADDPAEAAVLAERLQAANLVRRDLHPDRDGRGPGGPRRRARRRRSHGRARRLAGRRHRPRRRTPGRGAGSSGRRRHRPRRHRPRVVPERGRVRPRGGTGRLRRPAHPPRRSPRRGRLRARAPSLGRIPGTLPRPRHDRASPGVRSPAGTAGRPRRPGTGRRLRIPDRASSARPDRPGEPGSAHRRRGPHRDPCPSRQRRPRPAHPAQAARRRRRHRLRSRATSSAPSARATGSTSWPAWSPGGSAATSPSSSRSATSRSPARAAPAAGVRRTAGGATRGRGPMTDSAPRRRRSGRPSDPFGIGPAATSSRPILAAIGLVLIALRHARPVHRLGAPAGRWLGRDR